MKRYVPYILVAVALLGLNIGRWVITGDPAHASEDAKVSDQIAPRDLVLRVAPAVQPDRAPVRDLFFAKPAPVALRASRPVQPAGPPPKSAEQLAAEEAQSELARLNVTGIVFRNGKGQAYVTRGEESFVVQAGDRVAERFEVETISADYVSVRDIQTGIEKQISLQGN